MSLPGVKCEGCHSTVAGHKWGKIKAADQGWFFTKDGKAYCPRHVPAWVADWRARRKS